LRRDVRHVVTTDLTARIRKPGVQQKPRRFDPAAAKKHGLASLPSVDTVVSIDDRNDAAARVPLEPVHDALRANLRTVAHREGQVRHVHTRLGTDAATLVTVSAVDARRPYRVFGLNEIS